MYRDVAFWSLLLLQSSGHTTWSHAFVVVRNRATLSPEGALTSLPRARNVVWQRLDGPVLIVKPAGIIDHKLELTKMQLDDTKAKDHRFPDDCTVTFNFDSAKAAPDTSTENIGQAMAVAYASHERVHNRELSHIAH